MPSTQLWLDTFLPLTLARELSYDTVQVFTLIAMEPPIRVSGSGSADYVRDAKVRIWYIARYPIRVVRYFSGASC